MTKGIGTDILSFDKLRWVLSQPDYQKDPFIRKTYTAAEIALAESRAVPLFCYATRFAGKEAVFKALGVSGDAVPLGEIEILADENSAPVVRLLGRAAQAAAEKGITRVLLSLSYEEQYAVAYALAE